MLQQTRPSKCRCCLIFLKKLSYFHKEFLSPIPLVQFNWYCERGGDNDEVLTWGRDLVDLFFPKDVYRRSLFFFIGLRARSRALADVFKKRKENEKKNKTTSLYKLIFFNSYEISYVYAPHYFKLTSKVQPAVTGREDSCLSISFLI